MSRGRMLVMGLCLALVGAACSDEGDDGGGEPSPAPTAESARLRLVHASPDAPAVDIWAAGLNTPLFTNVGYTQAAAYRDVAAGTYTLQIRPAGAASTTAPLYNSPPVTLTRDTQVTAVVEAAPAGRICSVYVPAATSR